jgi:hypothetical protein
MFWFDQEVFVAAMAVVGHIAGHREPLGSHVMILTGVA